MIGWQAYMGIIIVKITCADSVKFLNLLNEAKIRLRNVEHLGSLELQLTVTKKDYARVCDISEKVGATVQPVAIKGITVLLQSLMKRKVLVIAFTVFLLLAFYLPNQILFVSVEGNTDISSNQIIEVAEKYGIRFGASRRKIRSEVLKNALLQEIPQLQWAGINTVGCTATISVREKTAVMEPEEEKNQVASIIATRDGVIRSCTVYQGNQLCTVGQVVKEGQTLVSGYTDCGLLSKASKAKAEIEALTFREIQAVSPSASTIRGTEQHRITRYSLRIGKNLIKLYKDSGNLDATCVKIFSEEYLHLPGGFQLPIALVKEEIVIYDDADESTTATEEPDWLENFTLSYLKDIMIAGQVITGQPQIETDENGSYLYGKYACTEMIGQIKYEQTILKDGNND